MLFDRAKPSIAEEEDEYRWHVLTRLREAGVLDELSEDYAMWRLAHLVGAGSRERVHDELWNNPIGWQPVLKGHAFEEGGSLVSNCRPTGSPRSIGHSGYTPCCAHSRPPERLSIWACATGS
jgi:hypothetical protein